MNLTDLGLPILLKALSVLLPENEGVVINVPEEHRNLIPHDRIIVFNANDEIGFAEEHRGFLEGQRLVIE